MAKKSLKKSPVTQVQDPMTALAVWDNILINGDTNLTAEEFKIIMFLTAHVDSRRTKKLEKFTFRTADFVNAIGLGINNSTYFEMVMKKLHKKRIIVENLAENSVAGIHWIDYFKIHRAAVGGFIFTPAKLSEYLLDQNVRDRQYTELEMARMGGTTEIRLGKELAPFLLSLKRNFTEIEIKHILSMKSIYSMRIYVLCKQFEKTGERRMPIDIFRRQLGLENKYADWKNLKQRVLRPAEKEISEKTGLLVDIKAEAVVGRQYDHLTFHINKKSAAKLPPPKPAAAPRPKTWAEQEAARNKIRLEIDRLDTRLMDYVRGLWGTLPADEQSPYILTAQADAFPPPGMTEEDRAQRLYLTELRESGKDKTVRELAEQVEDLERRMSLIG